MNWLIYGDILDRHVVDSFCDALEESGHVVTRLPSLQRSHRYLADCDFQRDILARLEVSLRDAEIDVLFNFRASELGPAAVESVRDRGVTTIIWLPDDPLLYDLSYKYVVDAYDIVLHCGHADVISFYQEKHPGINGFNFPFWSGSKYYYYSYDPENATCDLGFVGNCHTKNRAGRYELLASLPFRVSLYGLLPHGFVDHAGIHRGYLDKCHPEVIGRFRVALNIPQFFRDSADTEYQFDGLSRFESFFFPSRIIQQAGCGVPTVTPRTRHADKIIPSLIIYESRDDLVAKVAHLLGHPEELLAVSAQARRDFETFLTAAARVAMLEHLLEVPERNYSLEERCDLWKEFAGAKALPTSLPWVGVAGATGADSHSLPREEGGSRGKEETVRPPDFTEPGIMLSEAGIRSGSLIDRLAHVATMVRREERQLMFWMGRSDPREGDFVEFATTLECLTGQGYWTSIDVHSPYSNQQYKGRLFYQILLNDRLLLEEDISDWDEANSVVIRWRAAQPTNELSIRVVTKAGCETWNWGWAGRLVIKRIHSRVFDHPGGYEVTASSPYSIIYREAAIGHEPVSSSPATGGSRPYGLGNNYLLPSREIPRKVVVCSTGKSQRISRTIIVIKYLLNFWWKEGSEADKISWLRERNRLFVTRCLPGIMAQLDLVHKVYVYIEEAFVSLLPEEIGQLVQTGKMVIAQAPDWPAFQDSIAAAINESLTGLPDPESVVLLVRLDNDDAISRDYIRTVDAFVNEYPEAVSGGCITFPYGLQLNEKTGEMRSYLFPNNHFLASVHGRRSNRHETALSFNHTHLFNQEMPIWQVMTQLPMWVETIHDQNLFNRFQNGLTVVFDEGVRDRFFKTIAHDL